MLKRTVALFLAVAFMASAALCAVAASQDKPVIGGVYMLDARDADTAEIDGVKFEKLQSGDVDVTLTVVCDGVDYKNNMAVLGDTPLGVLQNGANAFSLKAADVKGKELLVVLYTGSPATADEAEKQVYGTYNIDDMTVKSVSVSVGSGDGTASPAEVNRYMPIEGDKGSTVESGEYKRDLSVGDGWNASTNKGGNTPNVPIKLGFLFNDSDLEASVIPINTVRFTDGEYKINLKKQGNISYTLPVVIDNTAPSITVASAEGVVSYTAIDRSSCTTEAWLDGQKILVNRINTSELTPGDHFLYVKATDVCGNASTKSYLFTAEKTAEAGSSFQFFTATDAPRINSYANRYGEADMPSLRSEDEVLIPLAGNVIESENGYMPYQSFVIDVGESEKAVFTYTGVTNDGSDIRLSVYDRLLGRWVDVGTAKSDVEKSVIIDTENRVEDGKLRVRAMPCTVGNGSDTVGWISDTQYMTSFEDLNYLYEAAINYFADLYGKNGLSYVVHTGDLVDNTVYGDDLAHKEYGIASRIQKILDDAGVPNGVVSGNHDVCHKDADYNYYWQYFGADRYINTPWYGGQIRNNASHYDLVTVGDYDMLFLYLGCYDESGDDVIAWADAVLKKYSDRNAIICTHEYLKPSGHFSGDRAPVIWDELVVPNENVKMILCGHNEGVCNQWRTVEGTDRKVYEMLADYQFAELGNDIQHIINNCTCDGEGFIRLLTFGEGGVMNVVTYSPAFDDTDYYAPYQDSFTVRLDLTPAKRSLLTVDVKAGTDLVSTDASDGNADVNLVVSDGEVISARYTSKDVFEYDVPLQDEPYYEYPENITLGKGYWGYRGVSPTLRYGVSGNDDSNGNIQKIDLMPSSISQLTHSSGSKDRTVTAAERGFTVYYNADGYSWSTLRCAASKEFDPSVYNRLYFSVTADSMAAKWDIYVYIDGKEVQLARDMFSEFGNASPSVQTDIPGTWSGYVDISKYVTGKSRVTGLAFVAAHEKHSITFDYLFLGSADEDTLLCVTDDETSVLLSAPKGEGLTADAVPYKYGYTFKGWYSDRDGNAKAEFPTTGTVYAVFEKQQERQGTYSDKEVDEIIGELRSSAVSDKMIYVVIAAVFAAATVVVIAVLSSKYKKHEKKDEKV